MPQFDHVWVFAGGDFCLDDLSALIGHSDNEGYVAVDSGVEHCLAAGIVPSLILGDFDSANPEVLNDIRLDAVPRQTYPASKDASDLELALHVLAEKPPHSVTLVGISGARTDHMLFNWMLPLLQDWPFHIDLIDSTVHAYVLDEKRSLTIRSRTGQLLSVLALTHCSGVDVRGVAYPLHQASLKPGSTIGLSNCVVEDSFSVSITQGLCLVMLVKGDASIDDSE